MALAINGRLKHLRGSALGFRNLTNYIARSYSRQADSDPTTPCIGEDPLFLGVGQDSTETGNQ
ncbi:hypothetical protein OOK41_20800 [Micromonospora sp. NBC_01655]|uniref:hypothetical protein n=1 Tax=Micromonospora sp. NBC_01655 TaxID=2975983 RepID=UPI00224F9B94|nr:hypothetical protein [Micromonospora sp. NBC_01655]MCX4472717.1 hypothetical protein [Micromonospora sp. NBC_01655]